jgi:reactive intermediate/imine deaminase
MDRRSRIGRRGLTVALVAGLVGFGLGGGAPWGGAEAAESPPPAAEGSPGPTYLNADPNSTAPYSDAVRVGSMLHLAGQLGLDKEGKIVPGGITAESERMLENLKATLERNGSSMDRVVSCMVFLADIGERDALNEVYKKYWKPGRFPARSAFGTSGLYAGARVEISCIAVVD